MAGLLQKTVELLADDGDSRRVWRSTEEDSLGVGKHEQETEVPPTTVVKMYDSAEDVLTWNVLQIESKPHQDGVTAAQDLIVEFTTDIGGEVGKEVFTMGLPAGSGIQLPSQASFGAYVENFGGGTLHKVERVRVYNPGATKGWCRVVVR